VLGSLALLAAAAAVASGSAHAAAGTDEVTLRMSDGVTIACAYSAPRRATAGLSPGIMLFHGLAGRHENLAAIAAAFDGAGYATLACDARGHGASSGLADIDGPRTLADVRAEFDWFASRGGVDASRIGAWGISLGGGAIWRALVDGIPFAAVETLQTWTDLFQALAPSGLAKSGAVYAFLSSLPQGRMDPAVLALKRDALASANLRAIKTTFADPRSSRAALGRIRTPALIFQGRRDFAFDVDQGLELYGGLAGPKRLYIGDFGHQPSTFPGPDIGVVMDEGVAWFDHFLRGVPNGIETRPPVELAADPFRVGGTVSFSGVPRTRSVRFVAPGRRTIDGSGRVVRSLGTLRTALETFGGASVRVRLAPRRGWTHLVAVLAARTPGGSTIVVSDGGVPTSRGRRTVSFRLLSDVTFIPSGSQLTLTLAGTSLAQDPANALYLTAVPERAQITIGRATLRLPALRRALSR
jgi:predicted acyl esterase